jgi:hypothetical protein
MSDLERVSILSEALPYLQQFRGRTIVVKYGGAAMKDPSLKQGVINDLVLLACVGVKPVLVHGGGPEINTWLSKVGIQHNFKNGLRVTGPLLVSRALCYLLLSTHYGSAATRGAAPSSVKLHLQVPVLRPLCTHISHAGDLPRGVAYVIRATDSGGMCKSPGPSGLTRPLRDL